MKPTPHRVIATYGLFCVIAIATNLGTQGAFNWLLADQGVGEQIRLLLVLAGGTMAGLVIKYALDKRYIFKDRSRDLNSHAKKFSMYTAMGLVTTAIFWITEAMVFLIVPTTTGLMVGGGIGLCVGYVVKYHLDRRFVFEVAA
ncbi:MAG: polysaccharide biosynthesis protein GtrA [Tardiphaga sp.]|uniref:GtrA family protein n=1 Tax=Tardiphaga sp. TaxID=1926292 RepID=UPI00260B7A7F|nr:GtrA family protein [Tardiphaga sp.]MDB5505208.1 polysaccharide biosynthesis protein GtrA [Tardiphaga sp.]